MEYRSNTTVSEVAERFRQARRVLLTAHAKPDGDAVGSVLALARALTAHGTQAEIFLAGPVERSLHELVGDVPYRLWEHEQPEGEFDLVVVADTGAWSQLELFAGWLRERYDDIVVLDHHARGDDIGALRLIDSTAAATAEIVVRLLDELGWEITGEVNGVGEALFVGLATDTGWFKYSSAGARTFRVAARLLEAGVDKARLYQMVEENYWPQRLALEARALASLRFARDGAVAVMCLRPEDFRETGGSVDDLTGLVNDPLTVRTVQVSILLAQIEKGRTKISFRSKPQPRNSGHAALADVNALAQQFGGGGHFHAAGARINGDLDEALKKVLEAVERVEA